MINFQLVLYFGLFLLCLINVSSTILYLNDDNDDVLIIERHIVNCSDIKVLLIDRNATKIYVFVAETFYVDEDLPLNGIKELHIFAPTWNITKPVTFDLSGLDGTNKEPAAYAQPGEPGNDGTDGGNLFALANEIIHSEYLTIISNGGSGGKGQDGGGSDDVYVLLNADNHEGDSGWLSGGDVVDYYKKYFDERGYIPQVNGIDDYTSFYAVFVHEKKTSFNIELHPRKCCGITGRGGVGGLGGVKGSVLFKHLNDSHPSIPKFIGSDGPIGYVGEDARTCENFALNVRVDIELSKVVLVVLPLHHSFSTEFTVLNHTNSSVCSPFYANYVDLEMVITAEPDVPMETKFTSSLIRYKRFLLEKLKYESMTTGAQRMYNAIDESSELNSIYSLRELLSEACELEKNYSELKQLMDLKPLYQRMFDRVQLLKLGGNSADDHRALSHFQQILEFKLNDLQEDYDLILDVEWHAESVSSDIVLRNRRLPEIANINDAELQNDLNQLRFGVNGNLILSKYHHVIDAFRLAYFPFAVEYLERYSISSRPWFYHNLDNITSATTTNLRTLSQTIHYINVAKGDIGMNVNHIFRADPDHALYVWENSEVRDKIHELFDGKKVELFADVRSAQYNRNAFKFNVVDLVFRAKNETANNLLKRQLLYFEVSLSHSGLSTTRCNNNFFQIPHEPLYVRASIEQNNKHVPVSRTVSYDKIRDHHPILSPFTLWEVQLFASMGRKRKFKQLLPFADEDVDIELHATGSYIRDNVRICDDQNLAKFYTQI